MGGDARMHLEECLREREGTDAHTVCESQRLFPRAARTQSQRDCPNTPLSCQPRGPSVLLKPEDALTQRHRCCVSGHPRGLAWKGQEQASWAPAGVAAATRDRRQPLALFVLYPKHSFLLESPGRLKKTNQFPAPVFGKF